MISALLMSLNDNRWGNNKPENGTPPEDQKPNRDPNRDPSSPPDLEEVWRDFNRRLTSMFGRGNGRRNPSSGGSGGPGGSDGQFNPRVFSGGMGLLLFIAIGFWLASGFYIVDASERGVVMRFGKYIEMTDPGLHWRFPYPIEAHEIVNQTGVRTVEIGYRGGEKNKVLKEALMLTDDENIINIQFAVQYVLKDPQSYVFTNRNPEDGVAQVAETAVREIVGKSQMDFVLYEGREQIANEAARLTQAILDRYNTGIQISKITMQNAQPPEQVQEAFNDAVKAGQDRERQKNEGQAYANDVIPKARGTAARLQQEAEAYKARVVAQAEGDASRFKQVVAEYAKAPQITRQRMYIDTMQQIFSNTSKVLVDTRNNSNLLYLPLDKLMQATAAGGSTPSTTPVPTAPYAPQHIDNSVPAPTPEVPTGNSYGTGVGNYRNRDSMNNLRERGDR